MPLPRQGAPGRGQWRMAERVILVADQRYAAAVLRVPTPRRSTAARPPGRPLRDLRISVTDRCNFRCSYCMPKEVFDRDYAFLPHGSLLSFDGRSRTARIFVAHGVRKIRLTGGEPLLRRTSSASSRCSPRCARPTARRWT